MTLRREYETENRRLVPAGQVILVTFISLLLAALLNANSLVGTIEGQPFGTSRRIGLSLARPIRTFSHWTGLDLPRRLIDDLVSAGSHHPTLVVAPPTPLTTTPPTGSSPAPAPTTTTTVPSRRTPTPQHPLKVWLAGDSLMGSVAQALTHQTQNDSLIQTSNSIRIGTGLARPDVYDWPNAIAQEMASVNPDVIVLIFGANDDQDMEVGGHRLSLQSPAWQAEYGRRVDQVLGVAAQHGRQVLWIGIPAVRRPRLNKTKDFINSIVQTASHQFPDVSFLDTNPLLDGPGNGYTTYLTGPSGKAVAVRAADGIHLTVEGADRVISLILADVDRAWALVPGH